MTEVYILGDYSSLLKYMTAMPRDGKEQSVIFKLSRTTLGMNSVI